jgi:hypothetical protein
MKKYPLLLLICALFCLPGTPSARSEISIGLSINSREDFYEPLEPEGAWIEVGSYGRGWRPHHVDRSWRPYCDGRWVWSDCGWYWESDEPWAWATYHYGSWVLDAGYGWVWIPDVEWAPAWVTWREGGDYIGWAPRGPRGIVVAPAAYVFVEGRRFPEYHRSSTVIVNNTTIINNTREIRDVRRENRNFGGTSRNVVINDGLSVKDVEKATGKKVEAVSVVEMDRKTKEKAPAKIKNKDSLAEQTVDSQKSKDKAKAPTTSVTAAENQAAAPSAQDTKGGKQKQDKETKKQRDSGDLAFTEPFPAKPEKAEKEKNKDFQAEENRRNQQVKEPEQDISATPPSRKEQPYKEEKNQPKEKAAKKEKARESRPEPQDNPAPDQSSAQPEDKGGGKDKGKDKEKNK